MSIKRRNYYSRERAMVFAIDPGETTGWAAAVVDLYRNESAGIEEAKAEGLWFSGQVETIRKAREPNHETWADEDVQVSAELGETLAAMKVAKLVRQFRDKVSQRSIHGPVEVVFEDFILRERTKNRNLLSPVRMTSAITTALEFTPGDYQLEVMQSPSNAKTTMTDDRLRRLGLWLPGQPHARDATRHLVLYMRRRKERG